MSALTEKDAQRGPEQMNSRSTGSHDSANSREMLPWYLGTPCLAFSGGLVCWLAFPPVGCWPLAWVGPMFWLVLIRRPQIFGRRPFLTIWSASLLHCLLMFQWVRLPHWSAFFGWLALAAYLSIYFPIFIGISRVAVHRMGASLVIVAPMMWVGLEWIRGHLATGFSVGLLGHALVVQPILIQIADLAGAYTVSFQIILVAACVVRALPSHGVRWTFWPLALAVVVVSASVMYGRFRLTEPIQSENAKTIEVALVQETIDVSFEQNRSRETLERYLKKSLEAVIAHPRLDLIVWPESMFSPDDVPMVTYDEKIQSSSEKWLLVQRAEHRFQQLVADTVLRHRSDEVLRSPAMVLCTTRYHYQDDTVKYYNTALLVDSLGKINNHYDKIHPVMFGEYLPLGTVFPRLYDLSPMGMGLTPGHRLPVFTVNGLRIAPNICFESTVPHLIRQQLVAMSQRGEAADVMVNVTNDGWFWGSSALDMHLACNIFRAVEHRRPMLVAANTGISAWIDGNGQVIDRGPRRQAKTLFVSVNSDARFSPYTRWGDLPVGLCGLICLGTALLGVAGKYWKWPLL